MKTCEYAGAPFLEPRSHPWVDVAGASECKYYDLTAAPALIRSSLEDFRPFHHYAAIEEFYALLERVNHPKSALESNDSAFTGPQRNEEPSVQKELQCSGRLMVLFRAIERNTVPGALEQLKNRLHYELADADPRFALGMIGTTVLPVRYLALPENDDQQLGSQLMISFWAWGDSELESMSNLQRLLKNLSRALRRASHTA